MKTKLQLAATVFLFAVAIKGYSQRYLTEVFSSVSVTPDVIYGNNISILTGSPAAYDLKMDVYQPVGDALALRPLIILLHTGSFLPAVLNGQATGSRKDSAIVEMCTRFAKRGYVAVAASYRLGWNPTSTDQDVRTGTLLNAVYRAIQDAKACVRYFRNNIAVNGNTYKVNETEIALGGMNTGGYVALAYATLNKVAEIQLTKFVNFSVSPPAPYINQSVSGNFDGTDATTLNTPNNASYSSAVNMVFNIGGAVGDTTWLEGGEVPIASMHCYKDPFAPYKTGNVIVPTTGQFVVEASGSYDVSRIAESFGNNAVFHNSGFTDVYTINANLHNNGYKGLYPFITPAPGAALSCTGAGANPQSEQGTPWEWWNEAAYIAAANGAGQPGTIANCMLHRSNPDMSAAKGRLYIDTIQGFLNPRIVCALGLAECPIATGVTNENIFASAVTIFPNPSSSDIKFSTTGENSILKAELYDVAGRFVKEAEKLNAKEYSIHCHGLSPGIYFTRIELNTGSVTRKIIVE